MIDLNDIRRMFAEEMGATSNVRYSFDTALYKVCQKVYQQGLDDGIAQKLSQQQEKGKDECQGRGSQQ